MTDKYLIERIKISTMGAHALSDEIIEALEDKPFDALGHLQDGGKVINENGDIVLCITAHMMIEEFSRYTWKPYHEPPTYGTREWAMAQDAKVRWKSWRKNVYHNFVTGEGNATGDYFLTEARYKDGWSLFEEASPAEYELRYFAKVLHQYRNGEWNRIPMEGNKRDD